MYAYALTTKTRPLLLWKVLLPAKERGRYPVVTTPPCLPSFLQNVLYKIQKSIHTVIVFIVSMVGVTCPLPVGDLRHAVQSKDFTLEPANRGY